MLKRIRTALQWDEGPDSFDSMAVEHRYNAYTATTEYLSIG